MHRPRHAHTIRNLRIAAFLLCLKRLLIPVGLVLLIGSALSHDTRWVVGGVVALGLSVVITFVQWIFSSSAKCPLCMMPPLGRSGCSRNRDARRLLGSYRLRVALSILLKGRFRCPFCNEPTVLRLKPLPEPLREPGSA
jgi:hypothetical protein